MYLFNIRWYLKYVKDCYIVTSPVTKILLFLYDLEGKNYLVLMIDQVFENAHYIAMLCYVCYQN